MYREQQQRVISYKLDANDLTKLHQQATVVNQTFTSKADRAHSDLHSWRKDLDRGIIVKSSQAPAAAPYKPYVWAPIALPSFDLGVDYLSVDTSSVNASFYDALKPHSDVATSTPSLTTDYAYNSLLPSHTSPSKDEEAKQQAAREQLARETEHKLREEWARRDAARQRDTEDMERHFQQLKVAREDEERARSLKFEADRQREQQHQQQLAAERAALAEQMKLKAAEENLQRQKADLERRAREESERAVAEQRRQEEAAQLETLRRLQAEKATQDRAAREALEQERIQLERYKWEEDTKRRKIEDDERRAMLQRERDEEDRQTKARREREEAERVAALEAERAQRTAEQAARDEADRLARQQREAEIRKLQEDIEKEMERMAKGFEPTKDLKVALGITEEKQREAAGPAYISYGGDSLDPRVRSLIDRLNEIYKRHYYLNREDVAAGEGKKLYDDLRANLPDLKELRKLFAEDLQEAVSLYNTLNRQIPKKVNDLATQINADLEGGTVVPQQLQNKGLGYDTCVRCKKELSDPRLEALDCYFHPECFTCYKCGQTFPNGKYLKISDQAFCESCGKAAFLRAMKVDGHV